MNPRWGRVDFATRPFLPTLGVMAQPPNSHPEALLRTALALLQSNQVAMAEARCREALAMQPGHARALAILGLTLHTQERFAEAVNVFEDLVRQTPREPIAWMNLGTARRCNGDFEGALAAFQRAGALGLATADFFYNVGLTHLDRHDYEAARAVLARATQLAPKDAAIRFEYAKACYESMHTDEAVAALEGWERLEGVNLDMVADIGHRLMNLGESERAAAAINRLRAAEHLAPRARLTLVQILERTNRLEEARSVLDALTADPEAQTLGSDLIVTQAVLAQREGRHEEASALFRRSLDSRREFHSRHFELFPLAKSLDALGRYDDAFEVLNEAHRSQVEHIRLTAPAAAARGALTMEITRYGCDPEDVAAWDESDAPSTADSPVFIVAFPRSGTTLLELTLDAHPLLKSMDEQPIVQRALDDIIAAGVQYPERLATLAPASLRSIRERYWARAREKVRLEPGQRLVDKNPLNLLRLPVIRRLFPNARILLAIRHPCDVILSCYMQHFRAPEFALLCSDLTTLAAGFCRSFDFWYQQVELLKPAVMEIRYERFVAEFEPHVRAISEFLELPWDEAMLAPSRRAAEKGFISTPSYSQVVQPISTKAVGRWRAYEKHFSAALPQLQAYLARWGYEPEGP